MDLEFWTKEWAVFSGAPVLVAAIVVITVAVVWAFRGSIDKAKVEGLESKNAALEERLKLAREQEQDAINKRRDLELTVARLKTEEKKQAMVGAYWDVFATELHKLGNAQEQVRTTLSPSTTLATEVIRRARRRGGDDPAKKPPPQANPYGAPDGSTDE